MPLGTLPSGSFLFVLPADLLPQTGSLEAGVPATFKAGQARQDNPGGQRPLGSRPYVPTFRFQSHMPSSIDGFLTVWEAEPRATRRVLDALTDESSATEVAPGYRTLGRLAWHLPQTIPGMMEPTGLRLKGPEEDTPAEPDRGAPAFSRPWRPRRWLRILGH